MIAVIGVGWLGCGSSEPSPAEKCEDYLGLLCSRVAECTTKSDADCLAEYQMIGMCSSIKHVSPSYDACMAALHAGTCSTLFTTGAGSGSSVYAQPAACAGVLSPE